MNDDDPRQVVELLKAEHRRLDEEIAALRENGTVDQLEIARLKKRKLLLKDEIQVLTDRIVQITHANWSPIEGSRGKIEKDVTLVDVSAGGDWSEVKVWYDPNRDLGGSTYQTYGFIYPDASARVAANSALVRTENTAIAMAQSAANQMASAVRPARSTRMVVDPGAMPTATPEPSMVATAGFADSKPASAFSIRLPSGR